MGRRYQMRREFRRPTLYWSSSCVRFYNPRTGLLQDLGGGLPCSGLAEDWCRRRGVFFVNLDRARS